MHSTILATGGSPFAGSLGRQLDPDPQFRADSGLFGDRNDLFQLKELFDDNRYVVADAGGVENRLEIFGILVPVADNRDAVPRRKGDGRHQFRLGPDFKADIVPLAEFGNGLHHLALLVHLDGIKGLVFCRVMILGNGVLEDAIDRSDPSLEHVHEPEQDGWLDLPLDEVVYQFPDVDGVLGRR
jgi:hypothetical protein